MLGIGRTLAARAHLGHTRLTGPRNDLCDVRSAIPGVRVDGGRENAWHHNNSFVTECKSSYVVTMLHDRTGGCQQNRKCDTLWDVTGIPLDQAVGARVHTLRVLAGASRDDLARAAQRAGLKWDAGRVAHLEQGRVAASVPTLIGVATALAEVSGKAMTLPDLMPVDAYIELAEGRNISSVALRAALSGQPVWQPVWQPIIGNIPDPRLEPGWGKVDDRLVADLSTVPEIIRSATRELYRRTATQERDARAGQDATPQKRGRITRGILAEVSAQVARDAEIARLEELE